MADPDDALAARVRHPRGLYVLYLTELWERFSFYGMKALLVLYLNSGALSPERMPRMAGYSAIVAIWGQPQSKEEVQALSSQLNELYAGAAYLTPLAGGAISDAFCGPRATMVVGGLLMAAGHACLATELLFLIGLLLLIVGNGGFKPNISAQLAQLYDPPGPAQLRDRGFAIFYTGINVGALLAPLVCGAVQQSAGYHAGFFVAAIGLLVGLATYFAGVRYLPRDAGRRRADGRRPTHDPWRLSQAAALFGICTLVMPFWACHEQMGNTLPLFFQDLTDRTMPGGAVVPSAWLQSVNPLGCVVMLPLLTNLWARQAERGAELSPVAKMALGAALQAVAWAMLALGAVGATPEHKASMLLLIAAVLLLTVGELYLSPVGLAFTARCVPPHARSTAIGFWFIAMGAAGPLAGWLGTLYSAMSMPAYFSLLAAVCAADAAALCLARGRLQRSAASGESEPFCPPADSPDAARPSAERSGKIEMPGYGTLREGGGARGGGLQP